LDSDKDGKVRVPDILGAVEYLSGKLKTLDLLLEGTSRLSKDSLSDDSLYEGFDDAAAGNTYIDLPAIDKAISAFSSLRFNGDGVVVPASVEGFVEHMGAKTLIEACVGAGYSSLDASGVPGVRLQDAEAFITAVKARIEWLASAESQQSLPLSNEDWIKAYSLYGDLRPLMDDYFRRSQVLAMAGSPGAVSELLGLVSSVLSKNISEDDPELALLPIAMPNAAMRLCLDGAFHPTHAQKLKAFFALLKGVEGCEPCIDLGAWEMLKAAFNSYGAWVDAEPLAGKPLPAPELLAEILKETTLESLRSLLATDEAMAPHARALVELRSISLMKRDFMRILKNFVNFDDFYLQKKGLFRSGHLYLDGREMSLCLDVNNPAAHGSMAGLSSMYLIYCNLSRRDGNKKSIVAALTAGDADSIFVGRNGVFYDSEGRDWDATIAKVVVQPISIREAFFTPYKWFVKTLEEMAMKRAANAEAASMDKMKSAASATAQVDKSPVKPESLPMAKKMDVGTVAAIGVALGSIGAMVTGILGIFFGLGAWMPLGLLGVLLLISGPSMILAYMKLRKRNLGPLLNAEGWAVNGKLRINVPFGATLSFLAALPPGSNRQMADPFAEKKRPWGLYLAILLVLGALAASYFLGWLDPLLGR
jgi:hypothetical protein